MTTRAKGSAAILVFDAETTYKTDPGAPDATKLLYLKEGVKTKQELILDETMTGDRNLVPPEQGDIDPGGPIDVNLSETSHAFLLKNTFGSLATTGASDPYEHTLKVGALPVGFLLEKGFPDLTTPQYIKINGCRIARATFRFPRKGYANATFEIKGAKETVDTTAYDATVTTLEYQGYSQGRMSIKEGGSAIATVTDAEFMMDNELDEEGYVIGGGGERGDMPEGRCVVTGKITAFFDDITLYNKAINSTETSLEITLDKNLTPARSMIFKVPELYYERETPVIEGPKGVMVNLTFKAFYVDSAEASTIQCIINNGLATF